MHTTPSVTPHHASLANCTDIASRDRHEQVARKQPRCCPRLWLRNFMAVIVLTISTIASLHSSSVLQHMNDLDEQRQDLFLMNVASRTIHQHEEKRSWSPFKFAIAYVIGGCLPEDPSYRYYFYNILISHDNMRQDGSKADVVVFVQMSYKYQSDLHCQE
jgi:hypothetical protein